MIITKITTIIIKTSFTMVKSNDTNNGDKNNIQN